MFNSFERKTRYGADSYIVSQNDKRITIQIFEIILGVLLLLAASVFENMRVEYWYDTSKSDMYNVLKISCIIAGLAEVILSPIMLVGFLRVKGLLEKSYVILYEDRIEGTYVANPKRDSDAVDFEVRYSDIIAATAMGEMSEKDNNLKIKTTNMTYTCFAIESCAKVANLINKKVEECAEKSKYAEISGGRSSGEVIADPSENSDTVFCIYCGTKLPKNASFCCGCGKTTTWKNL